MTDTRALIHSLLVVSAGAGGCAGAAGVPSQHVVHLLPHLLSSHLKVERNIIQGHLLTFCHVDDNKESYLEVGPSPSQVQSPVGSSASHKSGTLSPTVFLTNVMQMQFKTKYLVVY